MGQVETLIEKLCSIPTPAGFRYEDVKRILRHFGYVESNKGMTSGSRVKLYHPDTKAAILLHKPHGASPMPKGAVESVVKFLKEHGHI
jgi:hypothetical protein